MNDPLKGKTAEEFSKEVFEGLREQTRRDLEDDIRSLKADHRFNEFGEVEPFLPHIIDGEE